MDRQLIGLVDSLERQQQQSVQQQSTPSETSTVSDDVGHLLKRRLLGAAVLVALAVIFLPLVLDGSGSESRFRRVEELRVEPPRIIGGNTTSNVSVSTATPAAGSPATESATAPARRVTSQSASPATTDATTPPPVTRVIPANPSATIQQPRQQSDQQSDQAPAPTQVTPTPAAIPAPTPAPTAPATDTTAAAPATTDGSRPLQAWIIQAGSFSDQVNALAVRDQLRQIGHPAFVTLIDTANGAFYRVNVGPLSDQNEAQKIQSRVQQELGSETLIKQYP